MVKLPITYIVFYYDSKNLRPSTVYSFLVTLNQGFLESIPGYDADPETQYLRNHPPNQFLYFMKSNGELRKPLLLRGSQYLSFAKFRTNFHKIKKLIWLLVSEIWVSESVSYPGIDSRNP